MALDIYRRHNPERCTSKDTKQCSDRRRPCPIWTRGTTADGAYIRRPLKVRDWTKAEDLRRELEATGKLPKSVAESGRTTIQIWQQMFIQNMKSENLREDTIRKYNLVFKQLLAFAKDKGIRFADELDLATLQDFRGTWKDGSLSRSKKQERLRNIFRFAVAQKWLHENPSQQLGRIKFNPTQQLPFSEDEMTRILKAAEKAGPQVYVFVLVMRFSGLRISDVCTLRVSSLEGHHLVLRTAKTGAKVRVLLPPVVAEALQAIPRVSSTHFFWSGNGKLASITELWRTRRLKKVFEAAQVEKAHPHRFRHTFATNLLQQGVPVGMVATLLGNSDRIVEKHYSAWIEARQKGLDDAVRKANGYHHLSPVAIQS